MFRRSLAFRLLWLTAAAATLPALLITLVLRSVSSSAIQNSIQNQQTELARRVANEVNGEIRFAQTLLAFTARSPWILSGDSSRALQNLVHSVPSFQEAMIVSQSGDEVMKISRGGTRRRVRRTQDVQTRSIGAPFFSGNRLPTILITEPLPNESGKEPRALVAKMSFASLGTMMQQISVALHGNAYIVDSRGSLLAHPDAGRVRLHLNLAKSPVVSDWLTNPVFPTRLYEYRDEHGVPSIAVAYPIPLLKSAVVVEQPKSEVYAPLEHMRNELLLWTLLCLLVFIGLTVAIAWRILQPLRQLQQAADQIAKGDMNVQLKIYTGDELEELGKAFTKMAESLRQVEGLRRDLISMVVHDLKSPLSSILASMDYCLTGEIGALNPEQKKFLSVGFRSGHDLLMLIDNLLDVARLEEGKLPLRKESISPLEWVEEVMVSFRPLAESAKKRLSVSSDEGIPNLYGDRVLLSRVLANLISNALRHTTPLSGEVKIHLLLQGEKLAVEVHDNGPGIPQEYQERIFEKFVQVERKRAHLRTGTGLGLTFCKMAVEAHGGRIYVSSAPDQGSTFTFLLPVAPAAETPPQEQPKTTAVPA